VKGHCLCGAVDLELPRAPDHINHCDCTACLPIGATWGYFTLGELRVTAVTRFVRSDIDDPVLAFHFCPVCGSETHWAPLQGGAGSRIGVNMRLFEPAELDGIEARFSDGRNWEGDRKPPDRHPPIVVAGRWPT
jgi:hypothetical protein